MFDFPPSPSSHCFLRRRFIRSLTHFPFFLFSSDRKFWISLKAALFFTLTALLSSPTFEHGQVTLSSPLLSQLGYSSLPSYLMQGLPHLISQPPVSLTVQCHKGPERKDWNSWQPPFPFPLPPTLTLRSPLSSRGFYFRLMACLLISWHWFRAPCGLRVWSPSDGGGPTHHPILRATARRLAFSPSPGLAPWLALLFSARNPWGEKFLLFFGTRPPLSRGFFFSPSPVPWSNNGTMFLRHPQQTLTCRKLSFLLPENFPPAVCCSFLISARLLSLLAWRSFGG